MKIALISPYETVSSYGLRILSACLKKAGYDTKLFFIPLPYYEEYTQALLDGLNARLADCDVIGLSLTTNYFHRSIQMTESIREKYKDKIIVWGGIHPTAEPEECAAYADIAVLGEAEISFVQLLDRIKNKQSYTDVKGIAYKTKDASGKISFKLNERMPLIQNLDEIPFPDYSFSENYYWSGTVEGFGGQGDKGIGVDQNAAAEIDQSIDLWRELTPEVFNKNTGGDYLTLSSRGCPFHCAYCCNSFLKDFYSGETWFRKRSIENLIEELHHIKESLPFVKRIYYDDDAFMHRPFAQIKLFAEKMKNEIKLPFIITGVTPKSLTEEKLSTLIDAGLQWIRLGIETMSDRVNKEVFQRHSTAAEVKAAVEIIRKFHTKMGLVWYDFIIDNPWETKKETLETLRYILELPRPFAMGVFSLTYFPKTKIAERAYAEGLITNMHEQVYKKGYKFLPKTYIENLFMFFTLSNLPKWVLKLFINPVIIATGLNYPLWKCYVWLRDFKARRRR